MLRVKSLNFFVGWIGYQLLGNPFIRHRRHRRGPCNNQPKSNGETGDSNQGNNLSMVDSDWKSFTLGLWPITSVVAIDFCKLQGFSNKIVLCLFCKFFQMSSREKVKFSAMELRENSTWLTQRTNLYKYYGV